MSIPKDINSLTPAMRQYAEMKNKYPDSILFFRMGDFYEMFWQDAEIASRELNIVLTSRNKGDNAIPLAGIPYHAKQQYLVQLIRKGYTVAICEQTEDPKKAKGVVKREVVELVSPGTAIDDELLEFHSNNYILALFETKNEIGISFCDVSTGEFFITESSSLTISNDLDRIKPSEIVVLDEISFSIPDRYLVKYLEDVYINFSRAEEMVLEQLNSTVLDGFGITASKHKASVTAAGLLIHYLKNEQLKELHHIKKLQYYKLSDYMFLDNATQRNLQLIESRTEMKYGTLFSVLNQTQTPMGSRKLKKWILHPLLDKNHIQYRLNAVEYYFDNFNRREEIRKIFKNITDIERLTGKIGSGKILPTDMEVLKNNLYLFTSINKHITKINQESELNVELLTDLTSLADLLDCAIKEQPSSNIQDGQYIKEGYNDELDHYRELAFDSKKAIAQMERKERDKTGINNLKIKFNKVFGYYIEVTKSNSHLVPEEYKRKQTLVNAERYIIPELKNYEEEVLQAEENLKTLQLELYENLKFELRGYLFHLQEASRIISELDIYSSLAESAKLNSYFKPELTDEKVLIIEKGRHPIVEKILKTGEYVTNNNFMNDAEDIMIITGPNMAGKSTYLRQIGLIVLMAHIGSFVPADSAKIGITDRIFTRVGAEDDLNRGLSTFLVEMNEASNILNNATEKSLILLDEIGRGTSTFDGLSIAWAITEYLHDKIGARTLFATHYHELTYLEKFLPKLVNYSIAVIEYEKELVFLHKINRGTADRSYGIQVAQLAGLPTDVIKRGKQILKRLEKYEINPMTVNQKKKKSDKSVIPNILALIGDDSNINSLDSEKPEYKAPPRHPVIKELEELKIDNLSPINALNLLHKFKKVLENE